MGVCVSVCACVWGVGVGGGSMKEKDRATETDIPAFPLPVNVCDDRLILICKRTRIAQHTD